MIQDTFFGECQHTRTLVIPEQHGPHHAKEVCSDCHKFLGWVPKPETIQRRADNTRLLNALVKLDTLTEWERGFVRQMTSHKTISPKQQQTLDLLREKYFEGGLP